MDFNISRFLANARKGVSGTGALFSQIIEKYAKDHPVTLEPGDLYVSRFKDLPKSITAPTAYDVWYLQHPVNMLTAEDSTIDSIPQEYLDGPLSFLADDMGGLKPMRFIRDVDDLVNWHISDWRSATYLWNHKAEYFIHLMPFEIWGTAGKPQYTSKGPPTERGFDPNYIVGYLAFPMGQTGVMEVISLFFETDTEATDFNLPDELKPNNETVCEYLFPPVDDYTGKSVCYGRHIMDNGYRVTEAERGNVELLATPFPENVYSSVFGKPNFWARFYFREDETCPTPGEFVGILCKPLALPPHVWWFQETSPFLYAGNWFETQALTGGVVTAITAEVDRTDGGIGNQYTVKVQGREIKIEASDFLEYEVGDRVGILKVASVTENPPSTSFCWADQTRITEAEVGQSFDHDEYVIIPITFYNEV